MAHERLTRICVNEAEFAIVIGDLYQKGLGTELLARLLDVACEENLSRIVAEILPENLAMQSTCQKLGFDLEFHCGREHGETEATVVAFKRTWQEYWSHGDEGSRPVSPLRANNHRN